MYESKSHNSRSALLETRYGGPSGPAEDVQAAEQESAPLFPRRVSKNEIAYLTSQLAIMADTGINLATALGSIMSQEENPTLRRVINDLKTSVESGEDFSAALARHPKYFDRTYVALVRASEATGSLAEILDSIATYMRKQIESRAKVRAAMAYPAVMTVMAVAVTIFLLTYILPKFSPLFNSRGMQLPRPTIVMMTLSHYMINYWYLWPVGAALAAVGLVYAHRTQLGRQTVDWIKIHAPIFGPMFRKVTISRSIHTLGTMLASGVPMLEALQLSCDVSGNYFYERMWQQVIDQVTAGNQICGALSRTPLFPPMLVQMISSGEETGRLDTVLVKVSAYYDREVENSLKAVTSMIEPLMIGVMGLVVGGIAMALLLPIFSLSKAVG